MKKTIRILAIIYLAYLALVLLLITPALNLAPSWAAKKYLGREFTGEFTYFNPFTLSLEVGKSALPERDGSPFLSLDHASVDLSLESLWSGALVFDKIAVRQLYVHVIERHDGSFNFSELLPPGEPEDPETEPAGIPAVTIHHFDFNAQQLVFTNEAREKPFTTDLSELNISVHGLSTVLEDGKPYTLDAIGDHGGKLHWEGVVSVPHAFSEGNFALTDLQLHPAWRFIEPWVRFDLAQGELGIEGSYRVDWSDGFDYWIHGGQLRVNTLDVHPKTTGDLPDTSVALGSLALAGIELDSTTRQVDADSFTLSELTLSGWREGEQMSLVDLFAVDLPEDNAQSSTAVEPADETDQPAWTASLGTLQLTDGRLRWRSQYTDPAQLEVTPIAFSANTIKWPLEGDTELTLSLTVNGQTSAAVNGSLDLGAGTGALAYQLQALPIPWFNPNLPAALNAVVTAGELTVSGEVALAEYSPTTIAMDGSIKGFSGKITQAETSFTGWETVRWEQLMVDMEQHSVSLAKLTIHDYTGRIHINKDGSINASKVWQAEVGDEVAEAQEELAEGKPWTVTMPLIHISDSEIDFMDESLPITFRTVIGDINGDIKNISSDQGEKTRVAIKGSVDGHAPVALSGTAQPLRSPPAIDLELTFEGVDMSQLSPYTGTYAGYAIDRGVLDLDLNYSMEDNRLKGRNKIVIEKMKLGEKVASDKAVDLPLELALALLTDSNGVIDMDIPVSGNVDDPEFNVGSVIMGALMNLITKVITSPFTLLASLVDSEQDLQRLNFSPGSAQLRTATREKLDSLGTALSERPELSLVVTGRLQIEADRERLQQDRLQAELVAAGLPEDEVKGKGPGWEEAIRDRYLALSPGETTFTVREQYLALAGEIPVTDAELLDLASARATAVKTYLVNEAGLDVHRAVIAQANLKPKDNQYSGVELEVDI